MRVDLPAPFSPTMAWISPRRTTRFTSEFATAVAGWVLGINPFDQPDVESAKKAAEAGLARVITSGDSHKARQVLAAGSAGADRPGLGFLRDLHP